MENKESKIDHTDLISIVMINYNRQDYIGEQLDSLRNQTYENWELIISDDHSNDDSENIILKFIEENPKKRIIYVKNKSERGVAKNFENGLRHATGNYVAVCDSDDVWFPNKLEDELALLKKGNFGMVYSDLVVVDKNLNIIKKSFIKSCLSAFSNQADDSFEELIDDNHITAPTILFKSDLKNKLIPFSRFGMQDYWITLIFSMFSTIGYLNQPTIYYRQHEYNVVGSENPSFIRLFFKNKEDFLKKHLQMKKNTVRFLKDLLGVDNLGEKYKKMIQKKIEKTEILLEYLSRPEKKRKIFFNYAIRLYNMNAYREIAQMIFLLF